MVLTGAELAELLSQAADLRHAVQAHQLAEFARRFVLKLLHHANAAQSHVGQQQDHMQRRVVAGQCRERAFQMAEQTILGQRGKRTQYAAVRNVSTRYELRRSTAGQLSLGRQHAFDRPCTSDSHLVTGSPVLVAAGRFIAERCRADRCGGGRWESDIVVMIRRLCPNLI